MKKINRKQCFSFADLLIMIGILLLLLSVILFFYRRTAEDRGSRQTVSYRVLLSSIDATLFPPSDVISIGATVRNENGTATLGQVTKVAWEPHLEVHTDGGKVRILEVPSQYDLIVEIVCESIERNGQGIRINDIRIAAGERYCLRFDGFIFDGAQVIFVEREADK